MLSDEDIIKGCLKASGLLELLYDKYAFMYGFVAYFAQMISRRRNQEGLSKYSASGGLR
jgi:hypothetical protein